jgi:hypothetical protein
MASSSMNPNQKHEHGANETRGEQALEQFISARNEQGQFIPMGGRDYKDYGGSSSKDYASGSSKDYTGSSARITGVQGTKILRTRARTRAAT